MQKIQLAAEAGAMVKTWSVDAPAPDYIARLDYALLAALGIAPSITQAAARWGVGEGLARRLIAEGKRLRIVVDDLDVETHHG